MSSRGRLTRLDRMACGMLVEAGTDSWRVIVVVVGLLRSLVNIAVCIR